MTFGYPVSSSDAQASLHRLAGQAKPDRDDQAQPARTHPPLSCPLLLTLSHLGSTRATNAQNVRSCSLPRCDHIRHGCTLGHAVSPQAASAQHRACGRAGSGLHRRTRRTTLARTSRRANSTRSAQSVLGAAARAHARHDTHARHACTHARHYTHARHARMHARHARSARDA